MVLTHQTLSEKKANILYDWKVASRGKGGLSNHKGWEKSSSLSHQRICVASCRSWEAGESAQHATGIMQIEDFWLRMWIGSMEGSQPFKRCITGEQKYTKEPSLLSSLWDVKQSAGVPTRLSRGHFTDQGRGRNTTFCREWRLHIVPHDGKWGSWSQGQDCWLLDQAKLSSRQ